jgi:hypothetical protein
MEHQALPTTKLARSLEKAGESGIDMKRFKIELRRKSVKGGLIPDMLDERPDLVELSQTHAVMQALGIEASQKAIKRLGL